MTTPELRSFVRKRAADRCALACSFCNLNKGPNLSGIDPITDEIVVLFNPRVDTWTHHFEIREGLIFGVTPTGRATARVLNLNATHRAELRRYTSDL